MSNESPKNEEIEQKPSIEELARKTGVDYASGQFGHLEGTDPVTGDFIRESKDDQIKSESPESKNLYKIEQPLNAGALAVRGTFDVNINGKTDDAGLGNEIAAGATESGSKKSVERAQWSRRLVHTLSNRRREEASEDEDDGADNCIFGHQIRFTVMLISTLCLSSILSNILTFNFTYICMAGDRPVNFTQMTNPSQWGSLGYNPNLDYSSAKRSMLFMAVAIGALITVFPLTILLNKFGSRMVFGCLGYTSALATLLLPLAANLGFPFILIIRIVQGAAFSACLPVMGSITSHWSTLKQNGIFIAILSSFLQIAPMFTMPISGELCTSSLGWPSVYYLHGLVCLVLFTLFMLYHRNSPLKHPLMSRKELVKVMFNKGGSIYSGPSATTNAPQKKKKSRKVPYAQMYKDTAIWAILVASYGNFMGTQLSLQFMPTYINKVLHLPIEQTGMASAISPVIMFFIKLAAGQSSDRIKFISDGLKLRIYNSLSMGMMGLLFILLALLDPRRSPALCLIVLIASTCILGFNSGGFFKSSQMVSRQHSHFTLANISFLNCVCMLIVPLLNEIIAPENDPDDWSVVLWIHGIILNATNIFFCIFASAKPAKWTVDTFVPKKGAERRKEGGAKGQDGNNNKGRWALKGRITPLDNNKNANKAGATESNIVVTVQRADEPSVY